MGSGNAAGATLQRGEDDAPVRRGERRGGTLIAAAALTGFVSDIFTRAGLPPGDAAIVAASLVAADLAGVETHGVARVPSYVERLRRGLVNPRPAMAVEGHLPFAARLDGDNAMGALVAQRAMDEALGRTADIGIGVVAACHSNHFGAAGYWAAQAAPHG